MMAYRYKKMSAAPYLQGATGLKPKGICDKQPVSFRAFHPNNVEIISYLHNTIFYTNQVSSRLLTGKLPLSLVQKNSEKSMRKILSV